MEMRFQEEDCVNRFREKFPKKTLFVVIHAEDLTQAQRNTQIAHDNGADGVFLINHGINDVRLKAIYRDVCRDIREKHKDWFVGLNVLRIATPQAIRYVPADASALWVDDGGIVEVRVKGNVVANCTAAEQYLALRNRRHNESPKWDGLYFGSVAFKYQRPVEDPAALALYATKFMDVVVTSGQATGEPPELEKIQAMHTAVAVGDKPLAIASGITPENIEQFLPYAEAFLVATGISWNHTDLNPARVKRLAQIIHQ